MFIYNKEIVVNTVYIIRSDQSTNPMFGDECYELVYLDRDFLRLREYLRPGYTIVNEKPESGPYFYYIMLLQEVLSSIGLYDKEPPSLSKSMYIPADVMCDIQDGRCIVMLDNSLEGFSIDNYNLDFFDSLLGELKHYKNRIIFLTGDALLTLGDYIPSVFFNYWERNVVSHISGDNIGDEYLDYLQERERRIKNKTVPMFKGIYKNRLLRTHRIFLTHLINKNHLGDKINYSFGIVTHHGGKDKNYNADILQQVLFKTSREFDLSYEYLSEWLKCHGEKNLYHEKINLHQNQASKYRDELFAAHLDSYFEIVGETNFSQQTLFQSEKTFKSIAFMSPFVVAAEANSINLLREMGYDVFDDIIDHGYDSIKNSRDRMMALVKEISRLCEKTDSEWSDILFEIYPRLEKNRLHLLNAHNRFNELTPVYQGKKTNIDWNKK